MVDLSNPLGGCVDERVHLGLGEVDHRAGAHGIRPFVAALVIGFDVFQLVKQSLSREEIQIGKLRLGVQKDAPVQAIGMGADVNVIESVPILLHFPDEVLVRGKLFGVAFLRGLADVDRP